MKRTLICLLALLLAAQLSACELAKPKDVYVLVKSTAFNSDGTESGYTEYEYDEVGNRTASTRYDSNGTISYVGEYNAAGNPTKETRYNSDGTIDEVYKYEYDETGNQIKQTGYGSDGTIRYVAKCDAAGNIIKDTNYDSDGTINSVCEYEYEYDETGNHKVTGYDSGGNIVCEFEYEYDETGALIKEALNFMKFGFFYSYEYEYDEAGNQIKTTLYGSDGTISSQTTYENTYMLLSDYLSSAQS